LAPRRADADDCVARINEWAELALSIRKDVMVLCHGGPIAMPEDANYVLKHCPNCHGFYRCLQHGAAADRDCAY